MVTLSAVSVTQTYIFIGQISIYFDIGAVPETFEVQLYKNGSILVATNIYGVTSANNITTYGSFVFIDSTGTSGDVYKFVGSVSNSSNTPNSSINGVISN
jgi:hypothetical protein